MDFCVYTSGIDRYIFSRFAGLVGQSWFRGGDAAIPTSRLEGFPGAGEAGNTEEGRKEGGGGESRSA